MMKPIPPHIQKMMDGIAQHHTHKCPVCYRTWACQEKGCKPALDVPAHTPCEAHKS